MGLGVYNTLGKSAAHERTITKFAPFTAADGEEVGPDQKWEEGKK